MTAGLRSSTYALHEVWVRLEDEHHELADAIERARSRGADVAPMRARQDRLLLDINAVVAKIRDAPASTLHDYLALLDVAIEHEIDLAADIAYYGPNDYPMIMRLLRALAEQAPGFEFNSLRRSLPVPGQLEEILGRGAPSAPAAKRGALEVVRVDRHKARGPIRPRSPSTKNLRRFRANPEHAFRPDQMAPARPETGISAAMTLPKTL